jgi:hypothetical protein
LYKDSGLHLASKCKIAFLILSFANHCDTIFFSLCFSSSDK